MINAPPMGQAELQGLADRSVTDQRNKQGKQGGAQQECAERVEPKPMARATRGKEPLSRNEGSNADGFIDEEIGRQPRPALLNWINSPLISRELAPKPA
ncbi:MAG: hypothetical protein ABIO85_07910 [Sphingomicrobium sp.]